MKDLLFFTDRYPFNTSEAFIENEIDIMANYFDRVFILPCGLMVNTDTCRSLPKNVIVLKPAAIDDIFQNRPSKIKKIFWGIRNLLSWMFLCLFCRCFYEELWYLISDIGFRTTRLVRIFRYLSPALRNKYHYSNILKDYDFDEVIVYSYWLESTVLFSNKLIKGANIIKKISRTHRWDLYSERNSANYLAFQRQMIKFIDELYVISDDGKDYLSKKYPQYVNKMKVSRLGTRDYGLNPPSCEKAFRIVSCSNIIPHKRVDIIVAALSLLENSDVCIEWVHFGAGQYFSAIERLGKEKLGKIRYVLKGQVSNTEILKFYKDNHVDLFINVSSSEGIPVSIMEAASFGIPIIATNVGGTREIVKDQEVGYLLDTDFEISELRDLIEKLIRDSQLLSSFKDEARKLWASKYSCSSNYMLFYENLIKK